MDKILENTIFGNVFEGFLGFMNYAYLESYHCILRWIKCIMEVILKKLFFREFNPVSMNTDFRGPYYSSQN
jgi:hypothetical protein